MRSTAPRIPRIPASGRVPPITPCHGRARWYETTALRVVVIVAAASIATPLVLHLAAWLAGRAS